MPRVQAARRSRADQRYSPCEGVVVHPARDGLGRSAWLTAGAPRPPCRPGCGGRGARTATRDAAVLSVVQLVSGPARWILADGRAHLLAGDRPGGVLAARCGHPLPLGMVPL
jgi:hypothetical protein